MLARFYVGLGKAYGGFHNSGLVANLIAQAQDHADKLFGGSTVYRAAGSWKGEREAVAVFEVALGPEEALGAALGVRTRATCIFARWLRRAFGQKEVLVVKLDATTESI